MTNDLRRDPILDRWVIIAPNRAARPQELTAVARGGQEGMCPFCEGREDQTPPEVYAVRGPGTRPNGPGWRLRVIPNMFPALERPENRAHPKGTVPFSSNENWDSPPLIPSPILTYESAPGIGAHEVVIESPRHVAAGSQLTEEEVGNAFWAYRQRFVDLRQDPRLVHATAFKNVGLAAGASMEHTHGQLIVAPVVPRHVEEELSGSLRFHQRHGSCVYCEMIRQEQAVGDRLVLDRPDFVAFCPFASRVPFETWIVPKRHASHYDEIDPAGATGLAAVMRGVIIRLESVVDQPAYNYLIHSAPFDRGPLVHYHWHIEVLPSLTRMAGFEWAAGCYINPVPPEKAARLLRDGA